MHKTTLLNLKLQNTKLSGFFSKSCIPLLAFLLMLQPFNKQLKAQINPTAQTLPLLQTFGSGTFTGMPAGFASWNGLSGASITTQALAETSTTGGNATITAISASTTTGGFNTTMASASIFPVVLPAFNTATIYNQPLFNNYF